MAGRFPENLLEDILSRVDIVEVISGYIPLKRAGRNLKACCPFHHEKTPSFMVSPDRQIYHCFGCGESGNAFKFLMRHERMEFPEAVEFLARKTGVVLPETKTQDARTVSLTTQLYRINELAAGFYESSLNSQEGIRAREYLAKRGITQEAVKTFKLGYAADTWDALINHLRPKGISLSLLEKAGLILPKNGGGYYDRFRNRIIIPIFDVRGRALGFGARVMDETLPKYVNSPETPIYTKGRNLYGLNIAKDAIRDNDLVSVVEGYLDFALPYEHGCRNIVASLGTALTVEQIRLIKRYTHNVVVIYDGDTAGESATLRTLDMFIEEEVSVRVARLPQGFDPDSFVRKNGIDKFKEMIDSAQSLFDYKLGLMKSRYNPKEIEGKAKIASLMLETLSKFKNAVLKSEYLKRLAQELDIKEDALLQEINKVTPARATIDVAVPVVSKKPININPTEKLLIKLMLEENDLIHRIKEDLSPDDFRDERTIEIVSLMFNFIEQGKSVQASNIIEHLGQEDASQLVCESLFLSEELSGTEKDKAVDDCIRRLKSERLKSKKIQLHEEIRSAQESGDEDRLNRLMGEFHNLVKKGETV